MNGIDWLFFCVPSDYRERLLNAFLMIWLIDEAITCLTIFCIECRDWLEYGPEGSWESFASAGSGRCDFQLARQSIAEINETLHENLKNDVDSNFRFALLLCCVVKNYLSFRSACVSSSGVPHDPSSGRISSRTRLSRRQILNYMLSINL